MNLDKLDAAPNAADQLRRAATLLRHTAGAAQIGPWFADSWEIYSRAVGGPWVAETLHTEDEGQSIANGAYIALMHPPVAEALARWLSAAAVIVASYDKDGFSAEEHAAAALAVARAILREPAPSGEAGERSDTQKSVDLPEVTG